MCVTQVLQTCLRGTSPYLVGRTERARIGNDPFQIRSDKPCGIGGDPVDGDLAERSRQTGEMIPENGGPGRLIRQFHLEPARRLWDIEVVDAAGRLIRQFHLEPEFDAAGTDQSRGQIPDVHRRHHHADPGGTFTLESIEFRQQIPVEAAFVMLLEDGIGIVDEDHGRRVLPGQPEHLIHLVIEHSRAGNEGAVDEEEFPFQPMRQGSPHRGLSGSRRAVEEHAPFRSQAETGGEVVILEGERHEVFERGYDLIRSAKRFQGDGLHFAEIDIARQPLAAQVLDESLRVEILVAGGPEAGIADLVGVQMGGEAMDPARVETPGLCLPQPCRKEGRVVLDLPLINAKREGTALEGVSGHDHPPIAGLRVMGEHLKHIPDPAAPRPWRIAADNHLDDRGQIVDEDRLMVAQRLPDGFPHRLLERQRILSFGGLEKTRGIEQHAPRLRFEMPEYGGRAHSRTAPEMDETPDGQRVPDPMNEGFLGGTQFNRVAPPVRVGDLAHRGIQSVFRAWNKRNQPFAGLLVFPASLRGRRIEGFDQGMGPRVQRAHGLGGRTAETTAFALLPVHRTRAPLTGPVRGRPEKSVSAR